MATTPDLTGFKAAQERLIDVTGQDVVLLRPTPTTWPPGTKLDPETGKPMDAWVHPIASGFASAVVKAGVAARPITSNRAGVQSTANEGPGGIRGAQGIALILKDEDHKWASGATRARVMDTEYKVEEVVRDGIEEDNRTLVFLEER